VDTYNLSVVLPEAKKLGLLKPNQPNPCYSDILNRANTFLYELSLVQELGLSTSQLSKRVKIHNNSITCYARELLNLGLITKIRESSKEEALWTIDKKLYS
jgi:hypothetical protein